MAGTEDMLKEVHSAAVELRNFTITFLSLLVYVSIIISSTTHEQILRIEPVNLPLLNVNIPIIGFYSFMPVLLLLMHMYILVQHYLFSQQAFLFDKSLQREPADVQERIRHNLGNLPFLHWLLGEHKGVMLFLMIMISVVSLIIWPLWTLLWLQMAFLPYHSQTIVYIQQGCLTLDVFLLAYLWAKILHREDHAGKWWIRCVQDEYLAIKKRFMLLWRVAWRGSWRIRLRPDQWLMLWWQTGRHFLNRHGSRYLANGYHEMQRLLMLLLLLTALFFSWLVSVLPMFEEKYLLNYYPETWLVELKTNGRGTRKAFALTAWLHEQRRVALSKEELLNYDSERTQDCPQNPQASSEPSQDDKSCYVVDSWIPRNLILRHRVLTENKLEPDIIAKLKTPDKKISPDILAKVSGFDLQGRHLEYADFSHSSLPKADLSRARLKEASLSSAKLNGADLSRAELNDANLSEAELNGADLTSAQVNGAFLYLTKINDSMLEFTQLNGADLSYAQLNGADLNYAQLNGANLSFAQLNGAGLNYAQLNGANLSFAQLNGAGLNYAQLNGADLSLAQLNGAVLYFTKLNGADLGSAQLNGAGLNSDQLNGVDLNNAQLNGAIMLNIEYIGLTDLELIIQQTSWFKNALKYRAKHQNKDEQKNLNLQIDEFKKKITQPTDFKYIVSIDMACLSDGISITACKNYHDPTDEKNLVNYWVKLACQNKWLAQKMISRTDYYYLPLKTELAIALQKEVDKGKQACAGLADVSDDWKQSLAEVAKRAKP